LKEFEEKTKIVELIKKAKQLIPEEYQANLPPLKLIPNIPEWHNYEYNIWNIGEKIRQIININKKLRKDIYRSLLEIALHKNAKRGRQSFIMLFGYVQFSEYAEPLIQQIDDDFVQLHILDTIYKMRAEGFSNIISNYINSKNTGVRNTAKKYLLKFASKSL